MENVCQNTLNCTIHKKSGEYEPIPLNKVRSNTLSIIFIRKMKIFTIFFGQNLSKNILQNAPNCTIFKNFLVGACPQTPIANGWLRHTLHGANRWF